MKEIAPRLVLLLVITALGGWLLYWFRFSPPTDGAGWVGAGVAFYVWMMLLLGAFGRPMVRFLRVLLGWS